MKAKLPFFLISICLLAATTATHGQVRINEFAAASTVKRVVYDANAVPRLGSTKSWFDPSFQYWTPWQSGPLPAGWGVSGISTNLQAAMMNKTHTLYLRKTFTVTAAQAAASNLLRLTVNVNDGFVAYINGVEVARANCGPAKHFMFAASNAYNGATISRITDYSPYTTTNVTLLNGNITYVLGQTSQLLTAGNNQISIQAHNSDLTSSFSINAGLAISPPFSSPELIALGAAGGSWDYTTGPGEPSGGIWDPLLARNILAVPEAVKEDYDDPADLEDWVELYNEGTTPADISGWGLTDSLGTPNKWTFPTGTLIPAMGYLMVMCDKRPLGQPPTDASYNHASFSLSSSGGDLGLFSGTTAVSTVTNYPKQTSDRSWSRDAGGVWGFAEGTPNHVNAANSATAVASKPDIFVMVGAAQVKGGHFTGPQTVQMTTATPGGEIRYTLNGSIPTATSTLYTAPITATAPNAKTAVVIRARTFAAGLKDSDYETASFLIDQDSRLKGVPALLFTGDTQRSLYAPHGIMTIVGGTFTPVSAPEWDQQWSATSASDYNLVMQDGDPAEREANMEWYAPPGYYTSGQSFSQNVGIGLRVSWSPYSRPRADLAGAAASPINAFDTESKNSYNLFFRSDFGADSSIQYRFFPNYPINRFKNMRLRAGKNDIANPFYTDELMRRAWINMGHQGAKGAIVTHYVNGAYKGYYNLCERIRLPFYQEHYSSTNLWDVRYNYEWEEGDSSMYYTDLYPQLTNTSNPNYNLTIAANYALLCERMDPIETADYFLLNIFGSTWDWPLNNFVMARERATGPQGRFHWTVWDAEGALGNQAFFNKQVDYNTVLKDLIAPTAHGVDDSELAQIFRGFMRSPQWRRLFADRVRKHLFNGGALDTTVSTSKIHQDRNSLVAEVTPLWRYANNSSTLNLTENYWTWWVNGGSIPSSVNGGARTVKSRRGYLLPTGKPGDPGYIPGWLRDPNQDGNLNDTLWPVTEAPIFNQNGGAVPGGFSLSMTAVKPIHYTTNGTDPADGGGTLYTSALTLTASATVKARAYNSATSEWSPLTEAAFQVAVSPPTAANLVISEIQYNPVGGDTFEFIRLMNIGSSPVDITKLQFTAGITFSFASGTGTGLSPTNVPLTEVAAGDSVFIIKDVAGFQSRFGTAYNSKIAGTYGTSNLSNGGEQIKLDHINGAVVTVIKDFTYDDITPWPLTPDGEGPSLVLAAPNSNPDHNLPASWTASNTPGGITGRSLTYANFRSSLWAATAAADNSISGLNADPDGDGFSNLLEYALGSNPKVRTSTLITCGTTQIAANTYLSASFRIRPGITDITLTPETSSDVTSWLDNTLAVGIPVPQPDGSLLHTYRSPTAMTSVNREFLHVKVTSP
jgi:Chitobiase/beta-hexosaminidase C-terminal domain/CotH kinase protein/Lamin Tail Domain/Fn3 associated